MNNQCNTCQPDTYGAGLLSYLPGQRGTSFVVVGLPAVPVRERRPDLCRSTCQNGSEFKEVARLTFMNGNRAETSAPGLASAPALEISTAPRDLPHPNRAYTVNLVSPVRNDERNIAWVLERTAEDVDEIIVVDADSTDTTSSPVSASFSAVVAAPRQRESMRANRSILVTRAWSGARRPAPGAS